MKHLRIMGLKFLISHGFFMNRHTDRIRRRPAAVYSRHDSCRHFPDARWCVAPSGAFCLVDGGLDNGIIACRITLGMN
ncbi:hypothetical protein JW906_03790 [bacterium]|nr:hypothetical protein [bacterium]